MRQGRRERREQGQGRGRRRRGRGVRRGQARCMSRSVWRRGRDGRAHQVRGVRRGTRWCRRALGRGGVGRSGESVSRRSLHVHQRRVAASDVRHTNARLRNQHEGPVLRVGVRRSRLRQRGGEWSRICAHAREDAANEGMRGYWTFGGPGATVVAPVAPRLVHLVRLVRLVGVRRIVVDILGGGKPIRVLCE